MRKLYFNLYDVICTGAPPTAQYNDPASVLYENPTSYTFNVGDANRSFGKDLDFAAACTYIRQELPQHAHATTDDILLERFQAALWCFLEDRGPIGPSWLATTAQRATEGARKRQADLQQDEHILLSALASAPALKAALSNVLEECADVSAHSFGGEDWGFTDGCTEMSNIVNCLLLRVLQEAFPGVPHDRIRDCHHEASTATLEDYR